ncbi:MAG: insulinase family protein, partial [Gemmatimonadetes bacterium]|nr:insulinase family protein [Gemmatimonadota bacterium]
MGVAITLVWVGLPACLFARQTTPSAIASLEFAPLEFRLPATVQHRVDPGVEVFFVEDHSLPLVSVFARFRGGPSYFSREEHGATTAVPLLLRSGGTLDLSPDSVDELLEFYAAETSFGGGGPSSFSSVNTLTRYLDEVLEIWGGLLRDPAFDPARVEVWRGQRLDNVRRQSDIPARLAISKFNNLLFDDHPVGWELRPEDLDPEDLAPEVLRSVHRRIFCWGNLTLGVTGDVTWNEMRPKLARMLDGWPSCEQDLEPPPPPTFSVEPGVYVVQRDLDQSTIIIGKPSDVRLADDEDYFAAQIGNLILGGSGLTSRLARRVRTEEGLAYAVASVWTTPRRSGGIIAATTQTKSESTVEVIRLIAETLGEIASEPPDDAEVRDAVDRIANGFVFNFETPALIVSRQMLYLSQNLPLDWLPRFLAGVQGVTPGAVHEAFRR